MENKFGRCFVYFLILLSVLPVYAQSGRPAKSIAYAPGRSGILFDVAVYYGQSEATASPAALNEFKNNASIYDIKLGYIFSEGYFMGGEYSTRNESSTSTTTSTTSGGGAGAGVGFFSTSGFHLRAYFRFNEASLESCRRVWLMWLGWDIRRSDFQTSRREAQSRLS